MREVSWSGITDTEEFDGWFYAVVLTPLVLGFLHHIDHIIRGNHVGWPLTPEVNPFTYSLAVYPLAFFGMYLTWLTDRDTRNYWLGFFGFSSVIVTYTHTFIEPPGDIIDPHANPIVGYMALTLAVALSASLFFGLIYIVRRVRR